MNEMEEVVGSNNRPYTSEG